MNIAILGHGFNADNKNSVGRHLIKFLGQKDFHSFTGISAFASPAGVGGLSKHIVTAKKNFKNLKIVVGVDQKGTSKEALEAIIALGVKSYVFYQPSKTIFHPKIYLFEGNKTSQLIVGSSNLTTFGLFSNVETSILVSIDNGIEAEKQIVQDLKDYFQGIFNGRDPNLKKLTNNLIAELVKAKVVPTEAERKAAHEKNFKPESNEGKNPISKIFPKRAIAKIPSEFIGTRKADKKPAKTKTVKKVSDKRSKLLWTSGELTERDLNIPTGSNTNPTGSMLLKKGKMEGIDQRHYFRDNVFSSLTWVADKDPRTSHLERASATFKIVVKGKDYGDHVLTLTHNTKTDSASYKQRNSMTSISWGSAKKFIAKDSLIGGSANLYKAGRKKDVFILVIE